MKKHIIGLALFSFIVSAAAVVYAFFNVTEIPLVSAPQNSSTDLPFSCWRIKPEQRNFINDAVKVRQAVFESDTQTLKFELDAPTNDRIGMHFFVKDAAGTRYINSFFTINSKEIRGTQTYRYLENLESTGNLYVMAESTSWDEHQSGNSHPEFDVKSATPILLDYGK